MRKLSKINFLIASLLSVSSYAADLTTNKIEVISNTSIEGIGLSTDMIPSNIQTIKSSDLKKQSSLNIADYLNENIPGVSVVETQGNPYQADVRFHGFTASPLLGSPQGLAVYQDGVRVNEPFGDVVSWDLIPTNAIKQMQVIPGTNPIFGLNALGGALSVQTKRGRDIKGGAIEVSGGSWGRKSSQFEYGGVNSNGLDYFISGNFMDEDGWRDASPTKIRQIFGQIGWQDEKTDLNLTISLADNELTGNGLTPTDMIQGLGASAVYTKPDQTNNKMGFITLSAKRWLTDKTMLSGNAYYRNVLTETMNGDINDSVNEQGVLAIDTNTTRNPNGLTPQQLYAAACRAGNNSQELFDGKSTTIPALNAGGSRLQAANTASYDKLCSGLLNASETKKNGAGVTTQITHLGSLANYNNQITTGLGYDYSNITFTQNSQYGVINADRGIDTVNAYAAARTSLNGVTDTFSLYATDTFSINDKLHLTSSARYNNSNVQNYDNLVDAGQINSLTANHHFQRINPSVGLNFNPTKDFMTHILYSEGTRAPTSMELGCANPGAPCKLPNSMAGDPPLKQVVTRNIEAGVKGVFSNDIAWTFSSYYALNANDIQFISTGTSSASLGYFADVGKTQRVGFDAGLSGKSDRFSWQANLSHVVATYESSYQASVVNNRDKSRVAPGDNIPGIPEFQLKLKGNFKVTPSWDVGANLTAYSAQFLQGNENNQYLALTRNASFTSNYYGNGKAGGYSIINLDTRYKFGDSGWQLFAKVNNLLDRDYYTGGLQGASMFNPVGSGYVGDDHRVSMMAPGAPRAGWIGLRWEFGGAKNLSKND